MKPLLNGLNLTILILSSGVLHAQSISPSPEPGLWRSEATTLINGQNLQAALRAAQQDMFKDLPAEQRALMQDLLGEGEEVGIDMECISAEEALNLTHPQKLIETARRDMPECTLEVEEASASSMSIVGNCAGNDGFSGDMRGELTMISAREMRSRFTGKGRMQVPAEEAHESLQGMASQEPVDIEHSETSVWVAADCGEYQPSSLD